MTDFFLNISRQNEITIAQRLISQLERHYRDSKILIISENAAFADYDWRTARYLQSTSLKSQGNIGRFLARNYRAALRHLQSETLVKLDPDTYIRERLDVDGLDIAGHIRVDVGVLGRLDIVCGGFIVYQRSTLQRILDSALLDDPIYHCSDRENPTIDHIYKRLDMTTTSIAAVNALYRSSQDARQWAIIHPVKSVDACP